MSYRPITDVWILARPKVKYYGAYPAGFPERARRLLGVSLEDAVLHVCAGHVRKYPYPGAVGPYDKTIDIDPNTFPDFCIDVRKLNEWPRASMLYGDGRSVHGWPAMLIDPPYTEEDAKHYFKGMDHFPKLGVILRNAAERLRIGGLVGVLAYQWPSPPKKLSDGATLREVAVIAVGTGRNQRARWFTVFEKLGRQARDRHTDLTEALRQEAAAVVPDAQQRALVVGDDVAGETTEAGDRENASQEAEQVQAVIAAG